MRRGRSLQHVERDDFLMAARLRRVLAAGAEVVDRLIRRVEDLARDLGRAVLVHPPGVPHRTRLLDDRRGVAQARGGLEAIGMFDAERLREDRDDVAHIHRLARERLPALQAGLVRGADRVGAPGLGDLRELTTVRLYLFRGFWPRPLRDARL